MTKLKPSTALDIDTKKTSRWFRAGSHRGEIDQILDLYWGGPERRITGLTLKIIGLNVIALIGLLIGIFSLGQYQNILIESKLKVIETELFLVAAALSQSDLKSIDYPINKNKDNNAIIKLSEMTKMLSETLDKRILVFSAIGDKIVDTNSLDKNLNPYFKLKAERPKSIQPGVEVLINTASFILSLTPRSDKIDTFKEVNSDSIHDFLDAQKASQGDISLSIWKKENDKILLTAAMPIVREDSSIGVVMLFSEGDDIQKSIADAWLNIVKIFCVTLFITIFLSIYLSGVIARPLRKLAKAAENVRKGKADYTEIPDMSSRKDEIGELSIVLRDMTFALWERMDSIEAFAADVAHEIKNPLTSLKSAVETARIVKTKEDLHKLLGVIHHDVERLDRLITDISHASRLDAELSRETFDKLDVNIMMGNLLNVYKSPLDRDNAKTNSLEAVCKGIRIRLYLPKIDSVFILGSETRLMQVFQNIIANAISFSKENDIISITVETSPNRVTVFIEDEGPGIPESKLKTIFERFYSERPQYEDFGRHSGLGLSICKQIISAHNGMIFAENRLDHEGNIRGARFVVILNAVHE